MLFISPPFGNYLHFNNTTSIKGSFTLHPRPGLIMQIFKTLRYSYTHGGWVNKIGLRNKGIEWAVNKYKNTNHIVSLVIMKESDIEPMVNKIPNNMNIEINISCPNLNKKLITPNLKPFLNKERTWCIIKLSPTCDKKLIDSYYNQGFRQFHCSNTLKVREGGLSGRKLIPYTTNIIKYIKNKYNDVEVIAGGGIYDYKTLENYKKYGANHFSVSTIFFDPLRFLNFYMKYIENL